MKIGGRQGICQKNLLAIVKCLDLKTLFVSGMNYHLRTILDLGIMVRIEVSTFFNLIFGDRFYNLRHFPCFLLDIMYVLCGQDNVDESKNADLTDEGVAKGMDASEVDADTPNMKPGIDHFKYEETDPIRSSALSKCYLSTNTKST